MTAIESISLILSKSLIIDEKSQVHGLPSVVRSSKRGDEVLHWLAVITIGQGRAYNLLYLSLMQINTRAEFHALEDTLAGFDAQEVNETKSPQRWHSFLNLGTVCEQRKEEFV